MSNLTIDDVQGSSAPAWKAEAIGDRISGALVNAEMRQQTDFDTGKPLTFDDGNPRTQLVLTIATDEGEMSFYAKPSSKFVRENEAAEGKGLAGQDAVIAAMRLAELKNFSDVGQITIVHTGLSKVPKKGQDPSRLFVAKVVKAKAASVDIDDI